MSFTFVCCTQDTVSLYPSLHKIMGNLYLLDTHITIEILKFKESDDKELICKEESLYQIHLCHLLWCSLRLRTVNIRK